LAWMWQIATARASAASRGTLARWRASSERTMARTCGFSALPYPTRLFLTRRGSYSKTGTPAWGAAGLSAPRAWGGLKGGAAVVGELDGGGDVAGREDRLDRDGGGPALFEQRGGAAEEEVELGGESERGGGSPDSAPHQREPALLEADHAVAGGRGAGVE